MSKKVGIVTIHFPYNYGAMLQAYATQHFLEKNNIEAEIIDFRPYEIDKDYHIRVETIYKNPKLFVIQIISKILGKRKKYNRFNLFLKKNIVKSPKTYYRLKKEDGYDYEILIAGSDQIWNPEVMQGREEYLLSFANQQDKIAYASSFGKDKIDGEFEKLIKKYLCDFKSINVREKDGKIILNDNGIKNVKVVCDPVFLLKKEEWDKVRADYYIKDKYVLLYSLQDNDEMNSGVIKLAKLNNYKIVSIHPTGKINKFADYNVHDIGPREFISLINGAEIVCSNSFHAVAFSIIYDKKIMAFLHNKTGSRVKNILDMYEYKKNNIDDEIFYYERTDESAKKINEMITESKKILLDECF